MSRPLSQACVGAAIVLVASLMTSAAAAQDQPQEQVPPPPPPPAPQPTQPPPPGYGNTPPGGGYGYQQPYQGPIYQQQPQPSRPPRRQLVPYEEGTPVPQGARVIERRKIGLIIPGAIMFAVSYLSTFFVWSIAADFDTDDDDHGEVLIPIVGPFIHIAHVDEGVGARSFQTLLVLDGLIQGVGILLFTLGMIPSQYLEYYAADGSGTGLAVRPALGPDMAGLQLDARF